MSKSRLAVIAGLSMIGLAAQTSALYPQVVWEPTKKANAFEKSHRPKGTHKANARKARKGRK
jgi:hypothetical protein